jgi:hypothetical protein
MTSPLLMQVDDWQTDATSRHVVLRISAERPSASPTSTHEQGFLLAPEQARQLIRDLSAAVLSLDAKRRAGFDADELRSSYESPALRSLAAGHSGARDQTTASSPDDPPAGPLSLRCFDKLPDYLPKGMDE